MNPVEAALGDAAPTPFWLDQAGRPEPSPPLMGSTTADLVIVGGGFTGLWAAVQAKEEQPDLDVVLLEAGEVGVGASGRNGGFLSASLTHGLANGLSHFPDEIDQLHRLGLENFDALLSTLDRHGIDARVERTGELTFATAPWQVPDLSEAVELHERFGERVELLDGDGARAQVRSPTYHGAMWAHDGVALVDPARLVWGLRAAALRLGVRVHDHSPVTGLEHRRPSGPAVLDQREMVVRGLHASVRAHRVLLATNAYPGLVPAIRARVVPVWDYVLMTEPLRPDQLDAIGWAGRQGLADASNQFHYYRRTVDDRILWGGYDAVYYRGNGIGPELEQRDETQRLLARQFFDTFPQLEGLRFTHRWGGPIATTTRFTLTAGTTHGGRVAYAVGYTGLGVGASRFGARVALDLLGGEPTELTRLRFVRRKPLPFPPEPWRSIGIDLTRRAIAAADRHDGRRGLWLRALDRFGVGFDS
ncbi:MAG: NAD(P)/FAD-dependent oxidoreductase [Acidimicrobiales bacterium]